MSLNDVKTLANKQIAPYRYGNGRVLFFDNCEHTNLLFKAGVMGAGAVAVTNTICWENEKSYSLSVGAANADMAMISKQIIPPANQGYIGLDFYFSLSDGDYNSFRYLNFSMYCYNSSKGSLSGIVRITPNGEASGMEIQLATGGGLKTMPFAFPINSNNDLLESFHHVKLVVDTLKGEFYYLMIDNAFFDLRGTVLEKLVGATIQYIKPSIELYGKTGGGATILYIDQIAITDQEKLPDFPEMYLNFVEM